MAVYGRNKESTLSQKLVMGSVETLNLPRNSVHDAYILKFDLDISNAGSTEYTVNIRKVLESIEEIRLVTDSIRVHYALNGYDFQFGSIDLAENNLIADGKNGSKYIVKHISVSECLLNLGDNEILGEFSLNELHKFNIIPIESVSFEEHYVVSMGAEILLVPIDQIIDFLEDAVGNLIADSDDIDDFIETVSLKQRVMMTICGFIKCGCSNREELRKIFKGVKLCNNNGLVNYEISLTDTYFDWFLKDLEKIGLITTKRESLHLTNKSLDILRMAMTNPSEESQE